MPCNKPITGYKSRFINPTGKRSITWDLSQAFKDQPVTLPCRKCIGCRLEISRQWAVRIMHEAKCWPVNSFLTLTYAKEFTPPHDSLRKEHYVDFMKRLRKRFSSTTIREYYCGEYGSRGCRPHYHAIIFNCDFSDKFEFKKVNDTSLFRSYTLEDLWPFGFAFIGGVTFESAAYVARYVTKKITGPLALGHYNDYDSRTGEIFAERVPEFSGMSRRPGVGRTWFDRFSSDVYPSDQVITRGVAVKPPKYYDNIFDQFAPDVMERVKKNRRALAKQNDFIETRRIEVARETILDQKLKQRLKRSYENGT